MSRHSLGKMLQLVCARVDQADTLKVEVVVDKDHAHLAIN